MKKSTTYCVENFKVLNEALEAGKLSQSEYDKRFTEARFHGLMNTPEGKAIGPIVPFAIGGSDLAAIEGTSPYTTKRKLQRLKLRELTEQIDDAKQFIFDFGHIFEESVGKQGVKPLGKKLGRNLVFIPCDFGYWNDKYPHFLAHFDGFIVDKDTNEIIALAEIKTTSAWTHNWKDCYSKGIVPGEYISQVQSYTWVAHQKYPKINSCYVIAWNGSRSESAFAMIEVKLDSEYAENILSQAEVFVDETARGIRYDASDIENVDALAKEVQNMYPTAKEDAEVVDLGDKFEETFKELSRIFDRQEELAAEIKAEESAFKAKVKEQDKELKALEKEAKKHQTVLMDEIADNTGGTFTDKAGIRWNAMIERSFSFDKDVKEHLQNEKQEIWDYISSIKPTAKIKVTREREEDINEQAS